MDAVAIVMYGIRGKIASGTAISGICNKSVAAPGYSFCMSGKT